MSDALYGRGLYIAVGVAYASLPITGVLPGQLATDDAGGVYRWTGKSGASLASWTKVSSDGADLVTTSPPNQVTALAFAALEVSLASSPIAITDGTRYQITDGANAGVVYEVNHGAFVVSQGYGPTGGAKVTPVGVPGQAQNKVFNAAATTYAEATNRRSFPLGISRAQLLATTSVAEVSQNGDEYCRVVFDAPTAAIAAAQLAIDGSTGDLVAWQKIKPGERSEWEFIDSDGSDAPIYFVDVLPIGVAMHISVEGV